MERLGDLASRFATQERPVGNLLEEDAVAAQAVAATRFFAGYAAIRSRAAVAPPPPITVDTELNDSEWAIIRPLFILYLERESALQLEASRGMGIDPYGRSSSEVAGEIAQYEAELPRRAFCVPIITV